MTFGPDNRETTTPRAKETTRNVSQWFFGATEGCYAKLGAIIWDSACSIWLDNSFRNSETHVKYIKLYIQPMPINYSGQKLQLQIHIHTTSRKKKQANKNNHFQVVTICMNILAYSAWLALQYVTYPPVLSLIESHHEGRVTFNVEILTCVWNANMQTATAAYGCFQN